MIPQYISMYLLFCLLMNFLSIYAPAHVAAGSLKPKNPKLVTVLMHMVTFMIFFPITQAFTLIPLGTEYVLRLLGHGESIPICLLAFDRWSVRSSPSSTICAATGSEVCSSRESKRSLKPSRPSRPDEPHAERDDSRLKLWLPANELASLPPLRYLRDLLFKSCFRYNDKCRCRIAIGERS